MKAKISLPEHGIWGQGDESHAFRWGSRSSSLQSYREFFSPLGSEAATHSHPVRVTSLGFSGGPATWGPRPPALVHFGQSATGVWECRARDLLTGPSPSAHTGLELQSVRCWELPAWRETLLNHPSPAHLSSRGPWVPLNAKLQCTFRTWIK